MSLFELSDNDGNIMPTSTETVSKKQFRILPPANGYIPGEKYTLSLKDDVFFSGEELKDARTLVFSIDKDPVESYTFTENVTEVMDQLIHVSSDNLIVLPSEDFNIGDIIYGVDGNNEYIVYKITELLEDGEALVEEPALDEVFSELEIFGEYNLSIDDILSNPDIETEIVENLKKSSFFSMLIKNAYANDLYSNNNIPIKVELTTPKNGGLEIKVIIQLNPGGQSLFNIDNLKHHQINIILTHLINPTVIANVNGITNFDIGLKTKTRSGIEVEITRQTNISNNGEPYDNDFSDIFTSNRFKDIATYKRNIDAITEDLAEIINDGSVGEIKLVDWPIPILAGIVGVHVEVKCKLEFGLSVELNMGRSVEIESLTGIAFVNKTFRGYSDFSVKEDKKASNFSLTGKFEAKLGLIFDIGLYVISDKFVKVSLAPEVGVYFEAFVTFPLTAPSDLEHIKWSYAYSEIGLYAKVDFHAKVKLIIKEFSYINEVAEIKNPFFQLGNYKIARGMVSQIQTVKLVNNAVPIPDIMFSYYDVKNASYVAETLKHSDLKFVVSDESGLKVDKGKIVSTGAGSLGSRTYVTASYFHTDEQYYSAIFQVMLSGSMIEGTVSAYSQGGSTTISDASVKLFGPSSSDIPLSSTSTDEEGKFSFSVDEGEYKIVISADGYRTMTSTQTVALDEIKYTEHILLINDSQLGAGSAAGTITNALNGQGLSGVQVKLRPDWNNKSGQFVEGFITQSASSGNFSISGVPVGYYTIEASLEDYYTAHWNIIVQADNPKIDHNFTLSPVLAENEIRVVLTWGHSPRDLDSHLIGRTPSGNSFNVYYYNKAYRYNQQEIANLDVDDTSSYGPETITILQTLTGKNIYAVHDYTNRSSTNSTQLSYSDAVVRVYRGGQQVAEYHVPSGQIGTYWVVFELGAEGIPIPINIMTNSKPTI